MTEELKTALTMLNALAELYEQLKSLKKLHAKYLAMYPEEHDEYLKPCPFCRDEPMLSFPYELEDDDDYVIGCYCTHCVEARGKTKREAIAAWNTRVEDKEAEHD